MVSLRLSHKFGGKDLVRWFLLAQTGNFGSEWTEESLLCLSDVHLIESYLSNGRWIGSHPSILWFWLSSCVICRLVSPVSLSDDDDTSMAQMKGGIMEILRFICFALLCCRSWVSICFVLVKVPAGGMFCEILGLTALIQTNVLEAIIFAVCGSLQLSVSMNVCVCCFFFFFLFLLFFFCLAGLPGHLAAPLSHWGLLEVADQGPQPGSVAEDWELQREQEVRVDVDMCASKYVSLCACESSEEKADPFSQ